MRKYTINLLPVKEKTFIERLMYFLLHYFRYIIVITQIIVIAVFFARFKLDQEIIDNNELFLQKQEILTVAEPIINEAQALSSKVEIIKNKIASQKNFLNEFSYIFSAVPKDIFISSYKKSGSNVSIDGYSISLEMIKLFYERLIFDKKFSKVNINEIKVLPGEIYYFSFTMYSL